MSFSSPSGVSLLVLTQVFTKLATFALNQGLIRLISPEVFGVASYLEFILSTVLFFSREAGRLAVQRTSPSSGLHTVINSGFVPLAIGLPVTLLVCWSQALADVFTSVLAPLPYSKLAIAFQVAAGVLELAAEPMYALNQYQLNFGARSKYESWAVSARCVVTFAVVAASARLIGGNVDGWAVVAFTLGQLAYLLVLLVSYARTFAHPYKITNKSGYFDPHVLQIWKSVFIQMIFKHLLTEGDHLLINYLCSVTEQGVYSVISNYGSMVARLLFQPIEESFRLSFTRILSDKSPDNVAKSHRIVGYLLIFYLNLSILLLLGGTPNASFLLQFVIGRSSKWAQTNIFEVFPQYVIYLPFLAFNGVLEAFFASVSSESDIRRFSLFMSFLAAAVFALLYILIGQLQWGLTGLIAANIANMFLRIVYCSVYLCRFYSTNGAGLSSLVRRVAPALATGSFFALVQYQQGTTTTLIGLVKSAALCAVALLVLVYNERALLLPLLKKKAD